MGLVSVVAMVLHSLLALETFPSESLLVLWLRFAGVIHDGGDTDDDALHERDDLALCSV